MEGGTQLHSWAVREIGDGQTDHTAHLTAGLFFSHPILHSHRHSKSSPGCPHSRPAGSGPSVE